MPENTNTNGALPRRGRGRSLRAALLPLAMAGAVAGTSLAGERQASANIATTLVSHFVKNAVSCLASGQTKKFGLCLLRGPETKFELSSSDLANIKDIVSEELDAHDLSGLAAKSDGVITDASEYYRNQTPSISALQASYDWAESIHDDAEDVMDELVGYGLAGARGYNVLAAIRHAMLVEMYNIEVAKKELGVPAGPGEYILNDIDLTSFRTYRIQSEANETATALQGWSDEVDAAFGAVSHQTKVSGNKLSKSACFKFLVDNGYYNNVTERYCYSDPTSSSGQTCKDYTWWRCSNRPNTNTYDEDKQIRTMAAANISHQQARMAYRDEMIGDWTYETIHKYERAATGDFEYCGNGTCAVGELDSCAADCAGTGQLDELSGYATWPASSGLTLLENQAAKLKLQTDGNLVLWSANGSIIWYSHTFGLGADRLTFQSNGDLAILGGTTNHWNTRTTFAAGTTPATRMALVGETFHLVDADGLSVWSNDVDWTRDDTGHESARKGRFCIDTSAATNLLRTRAATGTYEFQLTWKTDGNLVLTNNLNATVWNTNTAGTGKYLCNQEDGVLVVYDDKYNVKWASSPTGLGVGGQLHLVRDQLRLTTASGDLVWASSAGGSHDCKYAVRSTAGFSLTKGSSNQTVLETGEAKLVFTSAGKLQVLSKSTGSSLWTSSASGTTASFSGGKLKLDSTAINATAGARLFLADCNLFVGDSSTNRTVYSTGTTCP